MYRDLDTDKKKLLHIQALLRCCGLLYRTYLMNKKKAPLTQVFLVVLSDENPDLHLPEPRLQQIGSFVIIANSYQQALYILDDIVPDVVLFVDEAGKDYEKLFWQVMARCKSHSIPTFQFPSIHKAVTYKDEAVRKSRC